MGQINIEKEIKGDICVLRPCGYVDEQGGAALFEVANQAISEGYQKLLINFGQSPVINSTGISQILELAEIVVDEIGGTLAFCCLSDLSESVFKMVGLLQMGDSYKNEVDALGNLAD